MILTDAEGVQRGGGPEGAGPAGERGRGGPGTSVLDERARGPGQIREQVAENEDAGGEDDAEPRGEREEA